MKHKEFCYECINEITGEKVLGVLSATEIVVPLHEECSDEFLEHDYTEDELLLIH